MNIQTEGTLLLDFKILELKPKNIKIFIKILQKKLKYIKMLFNDFVAFFYAKT